MTGGLLPAGGESAAVIGAGGVLQPVVDVVNDAVAETNAELQQLGDKLGAGELTGKLTNVVEAAGPGNLGAPAGPDGHSNLITDLALAPSSILNGNASDAVAAISNDLTDVLSGTFELKDEALLDGNDPLNVVPGLVEDVGNGLQTLPILTVDGGDLLGGSIGDLTNSSSGHLIDIGLGPMTEDGLALNLLSTPGSGTGPALGVSVLDVGPEGPNLLSLNLLGGETSLLDGAGSLPGGILPQLGGGGLIGELLGGSATAGIVGNILPQTGGEGGGLLGSVIDIPSLGGLGSDGLAGQVLDTVTATACGDGAALPELPAVAIVGEAIAQVALALDVGDHNQNNGLLGLT
jgi:hypothetical protein